MPMSTTDFSEEESIEQIDRTWRRSLQTANHKILAIHGRYRGVASTEPSELCYLLTRVCSSEKIHEEGTTRVS